MLCITYSTKKPYDNLDFELTQNENFLNESFVLLEIGATV